MKDRDTCGVIVVHSDMHIVSRLELPVAHIVFFHVRKGGVRVCFGVDVAGVSRHKQLFLISIHFPNRVQSVSYTCCTDGLRRPISRANLIPALSPNPLTRRTFSEALYRKSHAVQIPAVRLSTPWSDIFLSFWTRRMNIVSRGFPVGAVEYLVAFCFAQLLQTTGELIRQAFLSIFGVPGANPAKVL
ncbi:MAG: hypothetical protein Q8865_01265 [Bacillota bacterium]|nr:hypothetical protein [Bacillota bacterium]